MKEPYKIIEEAKRLRDERFAKRNAAIQHKHGLRFGETSMDIPDAYRKTTNVYHAPVANDEGQSLLALLKADPIPHVTPPFPEDQPLTTKIEKFLIAMHRAMLDHYGPFDEQALLSQIHNGLGAIYWAPRRAMYKGQPKAPDVDMDDEMAVSTLIDYDLKTEAYKKDAGIQSVFEANAPVLATVMPVGNIYHPTCVYIVKSVPEREILKKYGLKKQDNSYIKAERGDVEGQITESSVEVVEYWDDEWCQIVVETNKSTWMGTRNVKDGYQVEEWHHKKGYVPFYFMPAFMTEQSAEEYKYSGPLDPLYAEIETHNRLRTMMDNVAYNTAFSAMKVITKEGQDPILDDNGNPKTFIELKPGKAIQLAPGQDLMPVVQAPEAQWLLQEVMASQQRIEKYSLSDISKGVSPGADTANSAISQLRRLQRSSLQPMADEAARMWRAIFRDSLKCIKDSNETVFVYDRKTDTHLSLSPEEIVTLEVDVAVTPDKGQDQLLIEKHAMEMLLGGVITESEFHEMRGKENPEEYVQANSVERLRKALEPVTQQQVIATLGMLDAVNAMIQANAETGDARNAVPGLMQGAQQMQQGQLPSGMGQGSPGQPRTEGVRSPALQQTTQPSLEV